MKPKMLKRDLLKQFIPVAVIATVAAVLLVAPAVAAKPSSYSPSLSVAFPQSATTLTASNVNYTISGCGYNSSYGTVTVVVYSPVSAGWTGADIDSNGCISVSNFSTQGAGTYNIQAWQQVGKKSVEVASTSFTL
jgi:hypothetical protein